MQRTWDLWIKGIMVLAICPVMHFSLAGIAEYSDGPTSMDLQYAWDVSFEPEYASLAIDEDSLEDYSFPIIETETADF